MNTSPQAYRRMLAAAHIISIRHFDNQGYDRYRAICSCGYRTLSYATRSAAQYMGDEHATTAAHNTH